MAKPTIASITRRIETMKAAEKVTKKELSALSRELLQFVLIDGNDNILLVNKCINACTPMNRQTAILYFKHFLPFEFNKVNDEDGASPTNWKSFGRKFDAGKKFSRKLEDTTEWLAVKSNDIWSWAEENVTVETPLNLAGGVTSAVQAAVTGKKGKREGQPLTPAQLMSAILEADGVTSMMLVDALGEIEAMKAAEAAPHLQAA